MWIKKATKEERLMFKLLDLEKELQIGFARLNVRLEATGRHSCVSAPKKADHQ